MSVPHSFIGAFWGTEFLSTSGFDALNKRLQDGKLFCKDMESYLKQRSKMEAEYSQSIAKLHKSFKFKGKIGQLEDCWNIFREELANAVKIHTNSADFLQKLGEETHKYIEDNNIQRKEIENKMKRAHQHKISQYNQNVNLKKAYNHRCQEAGTAAESYSALKSSVTTTSKELSKAQIQAERALENVEKSDHSYKVSVESLEKARHAWEDEMAFACSTFQHMEEDRIKYLRDMMWTCANVDSHVAVDVDSNCEKIRVGLETCNISEDIDTFIDKFQTGDEKPVPVEYDNYYSSYQNIRL